MNEECPSDSCAHWGDLPQQAEQADGTRLGGQRVHSIDRLSTVHNQ